MSRRPDTPCIGCGVLLWSGSTSLPQGERMCRPCRRNRASYRDRNLPITQHFTCLHCGIGFSRTRVRGQIPKWCSESCGNWVRRARRRARLTDAFVEDVNRVAVFERDRWTCQICRRKVDRTKPWPHPLSPVLDHIVPLAADGLHETRNTQCAHNRCNTVKGARSAHDQLRLIG